MTPALVQDGLSSARAVVRARCGALGLGTVRLDAAGTIVRERARAATPAEETLGALVRGGLVSRALVRLASAWEDQERPESAEAIPGMWAIPLPESHRRKRVGYLVAVALEPGALGGEMFQAACQSARLDAVGAAARLAALARHTPDTVRLASMTLAWALQDRIELQISDESVQGFSGQLTEAYEEISLLHKLGSSMNQLAQPEKFVRLTCDELHATLPFRWIAARFVPERGLARMMAGRLVVSGDCPLDRLRLSGFLDASLPEIVAGRPAVVDGPGEAKSAVQPVLRSGVVIGALAAGERLAGDGAILASDMKLLDAGAQHMTILLENAALYEDQQAMFLGTLEALTASIDAKDRYTCGHSERVAHLSMSLARAIGLPDLAVERVRIAGLVHDIGKIGVPESVLCKPGRLTDAEFAIVKTHPEVGKRILEDIPQLEDVLPAVLHHHERWDGTGYPDGLSGEDIPLYARIIGLSDTFDAMSSTRTYRSAMAREKVLAEIVRCAGKQFDPALAPVFAGLDMTAYDAMVARHLERESQGVARGRAA